MHITCHQWAAAQKRKRRADYEAALPELKRQRAREHRAAKAEQDAILREQAEDFLAPWLQERLSDPPARGSSGTAASLLEYRQSCVCMTCSIQPVAFVCAVWMYCCAVSQLLSDCAS
jgi:DNA topoisomerase IB